MTLGEKAGGAKKGKGRGEGRGGKRKRRGGKERRLRKGSKVRVGWRSRWNQRSQSSQSTFCSATPARTPHLDTPPPPLDWLAFFFILSTQQVHVLRKKKAHHPMRSVENVDRASTKPDKSSLRTSTMDVSNRSCFVPALLVEAASWKARPNLL